MKKNKHTFNMRLVIDTNIWVSALIGNKTGELFLILSNSNITLLQCAELYNEIEAVLKRPKIGKYLSLKEASDFLNYFAAFTEKVDLEPFENNICRDPKDSYLLALADSGNADYLVTGDADLLEIKKYKNAKIITFNELKALF